MSLDYQKNNRKNNRIGPTQVNGEWVVGEWGVRLRIVVVVVSHYIVVVTERELTVCTTTAAAATPKLEREQRAAGSGEGDGAHPDQPVVTTARGGCRMSS